jgi:hypothetical protein
MPENGLKMVTVENNRYFSLIVEKESIHRVEYRIGRNVFHSNPLFYFGPSATIDEFDELCGPSAHVALLRVTAFEPMHLERRLQLPIFDYNINEFWLRYNDPGGQYDVARTVSVSPGVRLSRTLYVHSVVNLPDRDLWTWGQAVRTELAGWCGTE